jgi:hypothetical protein
MNKEKIPEKLHHLIPMVLEWGIGDDGFRDEKIFNASIEELKLLVESFSDEDADNLNAWLIDPTEIKNQTTEYIAFSDFFLAYEYAESVYNDRISNSS